MKRSPISTTLPRSRSGSILRSEDGVVRFLFAAVDGGLFVERTACRSSHAHVIQSSVFRDYGSFVRWCDADAVRFDYPVIYVEFKRRAGAILERHDAEGPHIAS